YRTAYNRSPWTLPIFVGILALLVTGPISALTGRTRPAWLLGLGLALLLLPLLSLSYVANVAFLGDPDRIGFPVATGFVLVSITALLRFGDEARFPAGPAIRR